LPPETFVSTCGGVLGGKAAAEPWRWAAWHAFSSHGDHMKRILFCALLSAGSSVYCNASDETFEARLERAKATLQTAQGKEYDREFAMYVMTVPEIKAGMTRCAEEHPGPHTVEGFFMFKTKMVYTLELRPRDHFSECIKKAFEGRTPPLPPEIPYLNHFTFSNEKNTKPPDGKTSVNAGRKLHSSGGRNLHTMIDGGPPQLAALDRLGRRVSASRSACSD
jgi:hypothetical protein